MGTVVRVGVAAVVSAVVIGLATALGGPPPELLGTPVGVTLLARDGRTLGVAQSGECLGAGELRARETGTAVVLDFRTLPPTPHCVGGAQLTVWSVRLTRPLGGRTLLDATGGSRQVPYFRATDLPVADVLPPGFHHAYDAPGYLGTGSSGQWDVAASELFDAGSARLWLTVEYGRHWPDGWPPATTGALVAAHGRLARTGPGGLAWQERTGCGVLLSFALLADPPLPTAELQAVADHLRPGPPAGAQNCKP
ncbi:hypothetical protein [Streptacidiphilus rugosus]|uniref:hypothetical protein n=1 Tax=Streptacidiphilus rugosus TaxID=405783 RepID=UPI00055B80AF|nr:hypothetical protein [Streptacidiphilus rugosus]